MKITLTLIHNNDKKRISNIQPYIEKLLNLLSDKHKTNYYEVSFQPEIKPINLLSSIKRDLLYWKLGRSWEKYRKIKNKNIFSSIRILIFKLFKIYLNKKNRLNHLRSGNIEMIVTNKHIQAFQIALQEETDYLIIFEDDAVFKEDSIKKIYNLVNKLGGGKKELTYIDLAGGCKLDDLKINKLESKKDKYFRYYDKPVTNTACSYIISHNLLKHFNQLLISKPMLRYIGIDWMMNKLFIEIDKEKKYIDCRHSDPTFLNHGSVTGDFKAWER